MDLNILVITYWKYSDALIQTYTLPYLRLIKKVNPKAKIWLVTQEAEKEKLALRGPSSKDPFIQHVTYKYSPLGIIGSWNVLWMILSLFVLMVRRKIGFIHTWGTPAGVIAVPLSILTDKPLILDSYEPHAEAMVENGTWAENSFAFQVLSKFEEWQSKRAKFVISATEGMRNYAREKFDIEFENNFFVKPACVDLDLFGLQLRKKSQLLDELQLRDKIVAVYAGKFGGIYLDVEVFDLVKVAIEYWGDRFRFLLLTGHSEDEIKEMREKHGIGDEVVVQKFVPHREIPNYMGLADFGLTPVKPVPTKRYCTPIKDGEYWALGLPVIITKNISDDSDIIEEEEIGYVLQDLTLKEYKSAVEKIDAILSDDHEKTTLKIRTIAEQYRNFSLAEDVYRSIYGKI